MGEHVQACGCSDHRGQALCIFRVYDTQGGFEPSVGYTRLGMHLNQIEDGHTRGLTACTRRGGNREQRLESPWNRQAFANGRVHIV